MRGWGIRLQVLLLALIPTLLISVLLVAYFTSTRLEDLEKVFRERGEAITLKLVPPSAYSVATNNRVNLQNLALAALNEHDVQGIAFYNEHGHEITSVGKISPEFKIPITKDLGSDLFVLEGDPLVIIAPIVQYNYEYNNKIESTSVQNEKLVGWLKVELNTKTVHLHEYLVLIHTTLILLLGLSISGLHALQMGRNVTRPILELAQAVERIKQGDLSTRLPTSNYRELHVLETGINTMAKALQDAQIELQNKVQQATLSLRHSLETIEVQNLELEIARKAAETTSQIKSEFLANMSHEIRTPLNGVVGFTNLLNRTELNTTQKEYVTTIQKSSKTLLSIINDILDFSKIEAGKLKIERQIMNIRECVEETLTLLAPNALEKSLSLVPLIYSNVPSLVLGDPLRIKQVITNLVNNAIKFTELGSVIVRITLDSDNLTKAILRIAVIDTGIGLTEPEQHELFQAFHQVNLNLSQKVGGTGLGLVICKKLVEQMKGEIGLESELSKGSTFWFTCEVGKVGEIPRGNNASPIPLKNEFNSEIHILAVDDNLDNLRLITLLLEELGIKVTAVDNGQEAVDAVQRHCFHLIFMDIRMPYMNGIEATQLIREFELKINRMPTPIIALTAHALISEQETLLNVGIDDYLTKPIDEQQLKNIIVKWVFRKQNINNSINFNSSSPANSFKYSIKENNQNNDNNANLNVAKGVNKISDLKVIDWVLAEKLAGGKKDLAEELFEKLYSSLETDVEMIKRKFSAKDWEGLRDEVHRLHGACCYCGVPKLKSLLQSFESALGNKPTVETIEPKLHAVIVAVNEILMAYA